MVSQSSKVTSEYQHPRSTADPKGLSQTSHGKRYLKRWRKTYGQTSLLDVIIRTVRLDERPYQGSDPEQTLTSQQQSRIEGRYLFWSTAGYIGLANAQPVEGHEIVLLDGDTAPLVLAKDEDYRIWCNCYLYGWMYGLGKNGRAISDKMGLSGHRVDPVTGKRLEARDFSIK
ncbi:hypothetical protein E8E12_004247 [Didymella heteroderae]|uniref:Uncharacterized protein n=1 Tax=Didymella heteroderae TaxID=1769908 RepID=A0A9P5BWK3_9PLEO|nr:hypothetical protein E8E12_004247 [Didymella heteroderae]